MSLPEQGSLNVAVSVKGSDTSIAGIANRSISAAARSFSTIETWWKAASSPFRRVSASPGFMTSSNALHEYMGGYSKRSDRSENTATESPRRGSSIERGTGCPSKCSRTEQLEIPIRNAIPNNAARTLAMVGTPARQISRDGESLNFIKKNIVIAYLYRVKDSFSAHYSKFGPCLSVFGR